MAYTNSPLVSYIKYSPNNSGIRSHSIDRISPHCVVGQCTIEGLGGWFAQTAAQASSNYGIDKDGRIGLFVPESNRSWCTSSYANDSRAVTIECASDTFHPYRMNEIVFTRLVELCADICKRNGKTKLLWLKEKDTTLNYTPKPDEMILTVHRWFAWKSCPGDWLFNRLGELAEKVTAKLGGFTYQAHCQTYGWRPWVGEGQWCGTQGQSKRLEGLHINPPEGVVLEVDAHLQKTGWVTYKDIIHGNNILIGTTGEKRRLEALRIRCVKNRLGYKLSYQAHIQTYGTTEVVNEGEMVGTTGQSKRLEDLRIFFR